MKKDGGETLSPEFWIKEWNNHSRHFVREPWSPCRCAETWDRRAKTYCKDDESDSGRRDRRKAKQEHIIGLLEKQKALRPGIRILDVGCGTGAWAFAFASRGAEIVGIDFSSAMIERMKEETPPTLRDRITCLERNWHDFDIEKEGFAKSFDLVFANMTPAINGPESFLKFVKASREWCFFAGWAGRRKEPLLEGLWLQLAGREKPTFRSDIIFPFNLVYSMGFSPCFELQDIQWEREMTLQEAENSFSTFLSKSLDRPIQQVRQVVRDYLSARTEQGKVTERTTGRTGFMIWRIA